LSQERQLFQGPVGVLQSTVLEGGLGLLDEMLRAVPDLTGLDPIDDLGEVRELVAVLDVLLDPARSGLDDIFRRSVRRQAEQLADPPEISPGGFGLATGGPCGASRICGGCDRDAELARLARAMRTTLNRFKNTAPVSCRRIRRGSDFASSGVPRRLPWNR